MPSTPFSISPSIASISYEARAADHPIKVASDLLSTIHRKSSNLCVSVDVTTKASLLRIADAAGPYCCCIKVSVPAENTDSSEVLLKVMEILDSH